MREKLRELALAATPGPWEHERTEGAQRGSGLIWQRRDDWEPGQYTSPNVKTVARVEYVYHGWNARPEAESDACADYIAAANPATVLALLDDLAVAVEALEFYANGDHWFKSVKLSDRGFSLIDEIDIENGRSAGLRARTALEKMRGKA